MPRKGTKSGVPIAAGFLAAVGWSMTGPLVRAVPTLSIEAISLGRFAVGLAFAVASVGSAQVRRTLGRDLRNPLTYLLGGIMAAYYLLATAAFCLAPIAEVALLVGTSPVLSVLLQSIRGAAVPLGSAAGTVVAAIGMAVVLVPTFDRAASDAEGVAGSLFALCAAGCRAVYASIANQGARHKQSIAPWSISVVTFGIGTIALSLWVTTVGSHPPKIIEFAPTVILALLVLGAVSTVMPTVCYAVAADRLSPPLATGLTLLSPVLATFWGVAIVGEWPSAWVWSGAPLVLIGLAVLARAEHRLAP